MAVLEQALRWFMQKGPAIRLPFLRLAHKVTDDQARETTWTARAAPVYGSAGKLKREGIICLEM